MSRTLTIILFILLTPTLAGAANLTGSIDLSNQYNTNFVESGLYEEAQILLTGEADSLNTVNFNLGVEHNFSEKNYSKVDYTLKTESYSINSNLNSNDHALNFLLEQRPAKDCALKINTSIVKHNEDSTLKKYTEGIFTLKGSKNFNSNTNLELNVSLDKKNTDNLDARDYFAYMGYSLVDYGTKIRHEFGKDLIAKLKINYDIKTYDHAATAYLKSVFSPLNSGFRRDQITSIDLDFIKILNTDWLADTALGYTSDYSNLTYYRYTGTKFSLSFFGYWLTSQWRLKYNYGNYSYPNRAGAGYSGESLQSHQYLIKWKKEVRTDIYLYLTWEALRNASNNSANNLNNDSYTLGLSANL